MHYPTFLLVFLVSLLQAGWSYSQEKVLIFSRTTGYRHQSIPIGKQVIKTLCEELGLVADTTEDASIFDRKKLRPYSLVIFLNNSGDILNDDQQKAFEKYIRKGHGYVGIHSAAATEYDWPWYGQLVGAVFDNHPPIQKATIRIVQPDHPATQHLPSQWIRSDEWYNFKEIVPSIKILATLDESTYEGGTNGENHPIAWYHEFEGCRIFYTALGHTEESYAEPAFLQHVAGGIEYVLNRKMINDK